MPCPVGRANERFCRGDSSKSDATHAVDIVSCQTEGRASRLCLSVDFAAIRIGFSLSSLSSDKRHRRLAKLAMHPCDAPNIVRSASHSPARDGIETTHAYICSRASTARDVKSYLRRHVDVLCDATAAREFVFTTILWQLLIVQRQEQWHPIGRLVSHRTITRLCFAGVLNLKGPSIKRHETK